MIETTSNDIFFEDESLDESFRSLAIRLLEMVKSEMGEESPFSVIFISEEEMRRMNREWRGIDSATDILSFPASEGDDDFPRGDEAGLGDIFISLKEMTRNGEDYGVKREEELLRLLIHGLLHLRGMDHKTNDIKTEPMLILQEEILYKILSSESFTALL